MKKYCTECGQPSEYISLRPKFCQNCGNAFDPLVRVKQQNSKGSVAPAPAKLDVEENIDDDGEDEPTHVPNISSLEVEIESPKNEGVSLKSIMSGSPQGESLFARELPESLSREEFLEQFKREAGSLRSKN